LTSPLGPYGTPFRKISGGLYLTSALLILIPIFDFVTSIVPYLPGSTKWRFASGALFAGFLLTPLLGAALAMIVAGLNNHRFVLRWIGILSPLVAVGLVGACALLALDIIELRSTTEEGVRSSLVLTGVRAIVKNLVMSGSLVYIGLACRSASAGMEPPRAEKPMAPIVGTPRR
jgi:hypothetical protein